MHGKICARCGAPTSERPWLEDLCDPCGAKRIQGALGRINDQAEAILPEAAHV